MVRRIIKPRHVEGSLPFGPLQEIDGFDSIACGLPEAIDLQAHTMQWVELARQQWSSLQGRVHLHNSVRVASFKWEPPTGPKSLENIGASMHSQVWRILAKRFNEIICIMENRWATKLVGERPLPKVASVVFSHISKSQRLAAKLIEHPYIYGATGNWLGYERFDWCQ